MMTLFTKDGSPKLVPTCTFPLTGLACVTSVYTEHAVFGIAPDGVTVIDTYGISRADLVARLDIDLTS